MKSIFECTAEHRTACQVNLNDLPDIIRKRTDWDYTVTTTGTGCLLKPTFRNMPYRNSFVPEIDITVSRDDTQTVLHMCGRPVTFVRIFMGIWFGFLLPVQALLLILAFTANLDSIFPVFIPAIMMVFGYLLCKLATRATFRSIVQAIQPPLP